MFGLRGSVVVNLAITSLIGEVEAVNVSLLQTPSSTGIISECCPPKVLALIRNLTLDYLAVLMIILEPSLMLTEPAANGSLVTESKS